MPTFYFAWSDEGETFNAVTHAVEDEQIFSLSISQAEGEFAALTIELVNPQVGLLSAGRNLWCWLSWDNGSGVEPLFNGRLIGIPQRMTDEVVSLEFVARPPDFIEQKEALAAGMRALPWVDEIWIQERRADPDTVLEARTARWHIDRLTLDVTASDLVAGEDGTVEIGEAEHFYEDDWEVGYSETPLRRVLLKGTVSWTQTGSGDVDLTRPLYNAFRAAGSPYPWPIVASMTGPGLLDDWPEPEKNIGGGWSVSAGSSIVDATWMREGAYPISWIDKSEQEDQGGAFFPQPSPYQNPLIGGTEQYLAGWSTWQAAFLLSPYMIDFGVHYDAARQRSETVTATLEADVQPLLVDPGAAEQETIELTSEVVGEPIDTDGGSPSEDELPIEDLRRNSYFKTARGQQSFQYLLLRGRRTLIERARAVQIKFGTTFAIGAGITCRKSVRLLDYRLPGGEATGKVVAYTLSASGEGELKAVVTLGCTIGYGVALAPAAEGTGVYAQSGYMEVGYQQMAGRQEALIAGELHYEAFDTFPITDDDGVDLLDMRPETVVESLTVEGGPVAQVEAVNDGRDQLPVPDPIGALRNTPTIVTLVLVPVEGGAFHNDFAPEVEDLVIPQTVNLEATGGSP